MLLSVQNLTVRYGVITALQDVSLHIDRGEIVTLIGANGAGKTTLLRTISGLLRPASGIIKYRDAELQISCLPPHEIVRLGVSHVPEGRQIFPNLTVRENLLLGAYQQNSSEQIQKELDRCCSLFPALAQRHNQKGATLSGGEQQMLAIARGLMAKPKLLLLDEPSLGLAPLMVQLIFEIIRELQAGGQTILLVEQNARQALAVSSHAYVMENGKVVLEGPAASLTSDPAVISSYLGQAISSPA